VRDVDAAGVAVNVDIVPAFIAGDGNGLDDVIAGGAGLGSGVGENSSTEKNGGECSEVYSREDERQINPAATKVKDNAETLSPPRLAEIGVRRAFGASR